MNRFQLSVLYPMSDPINHHVVHVFTLEVSKSLAWAREHSHELAMACMRGVEGYDALMLTQLPSGPIRLPASVR